MQDPATAVRDDKKAIEQLEGHRRHGEEVEGDDHFAVVAEKRKPPLTRVSWSPHSLQIARHTAFGEDEAEF